MSKSRHPSLSTQRDDERNRAPVRSTRRVLIVAVPPVRTLDVYGPLEVFGDANRSRSDGPIYEISIISAATHRDVLTHLGTTLRSDRTYGKYRGPVDTLLVAGFDGVSRVRYEPKFLNWLKDRCGSSRRFGSVCTGALVLAEAGLLDGRRATIVDTAKEKAGVLSIVMDGFRTEEIGDYLNRKGIAVRGGHHCAQPIHRRFGLESTLRASLALYNTCEEVDGLVAALWDLRQGRKPGLA
jgi:putative intracellular protease/amidase